MSLTALRMAFVSDKFGYFADMPPIPWSRKARDQSKRALRRLFVAGQRLEGKYRDAEIMMDRDLRSQPL